MDQTLICIDCRLPFTFSEAEQQYFAERSFRNRPKRCRPCRAKRRELCGGEPAPRLFIETTVTCAQCGVATSVPFKPSQNRPVYCRSCFQQSRGPQPAAAAYS